MYNYVNYFEIFLSFFFKTIAKIIVLYVCNLPLYSMDILIDKIVCAHYVFVNTNSWRRIFLFVCPTEIPPMHCTVARDLFDFIFVAYTARLLLSCFKLRKTMSCGCPWYPRNDVIPIGVVGNNFKILRGRIIEYRFEYSDSL